MQRCLQLARQGLGTTYPNPMVGAVVVYDQKIVGEGWHQKAGKPHAEVHAIQSVTDKNILKKATLYVSLEPCSHYGRTPPCADLIIASQIKKVVIGTTDPFAKVAGSGIQKLKDAGCEVVTDVLKEICDDLNKRFFTFHQKKRPYLILKWAETSDGFIAPNQQADGKPFWISNPYSRQLVHQWRTQEQGIFVGTNTVLKDDPELTARNWKGAHPVRITIDRNNRILDTAKILNDQATTYIFTNKEDKEINNLKYIHLPPQENFVEQLCKKLYKRNLQSVIIEGGRRTLQSFIESGIWDEARIFRGNSNLFSGVKAPVLSNGRKINTATIHGDHLTIYYND
ncbi:bifunctional diaminohydroxyphosphoribosylaminopyrimidine deaminase/5-amino-6-(5-phosphoribosylamino)uracil reductase RibD [Aquimarina sp. ERC-38]|uniref:bifunctional diaminohydroxyphosphoribosylaminopyrimidine deaminase/5-amino-6-(5-phosphoribosylamino)uracil reductase RibD n=1 Tax=Aquimarina sp. ERC-38 TaxID=2949996 RepID=UPI002246DAB8|nr:bifunctional diaminohydroxyphosphoribosylaminopyrimidine deaminase/5-amino-6-(5-phosphoribosylamino)uracil reductase RibD [Aquimarina sp. ERC-38]UZO79359.1 bifunctional diaminohydroxyphosphoribosylaminopyrimidine deaminase/5-amino-6-(5-phosphoribosylamino)uracil reductase RibD [Aquimarina sp. ERC-38]